MNVRAALVRNTAWYGAVTVVGILSGLGMSVILARGLGPERMGDLSYLLWIERALTGVACLGFALATVRYTADAYARGDTPGAWSIVRLFLRRQVAIALGVVALALLVILAVAPERLRAPLVVVALSLLPITLEGIYTHALQGAQRYDITALTSTVKMILHMVVAALVIAAGGDLLTLMLAMVGTLTTTTLLQRRFARQVYRSGLSAPPASMTPEMRGYLVPLSIVVVLDTIVWDRSEVFFLGLHAAPEQIAYYSLAFGLATRAMILPEIALGALLPAFSALHGGGAPDEFRRLYQAALRYVALLGAPVAALVGGLAPAIVFVLYGDAYLPAALLVGALAGVGLLSALRKVAWAALRAAGDRRCMLTATAVAAVVNLSLAALLIPGWTTTGAVIANAVGQLTATVWVFVGMARLHGARLPVSELVRIAGCALLALLTAHVLRDGAHDLPHLVLAGSGGAVTYTLACIAVRLVGVREWNLLSRAYRRVIGALAGAGA